MLESLNPPCTSNRLSDAVCLSSIPVGSSAKVRNRDVEHCSAGLHGNAHYHATNGGQRQQYDRRVASRRKLLPVELCLLRHPGRRAVHLSFPGGGGQLHGADRHHPPPGHAH